jgi:hypothetical protein
MGHKSLRVLVIASIVASLPTWSRQVLLAYAAPEAGQCVVSTQTADGPTHASIQLAVNDSQCQDVVIGVGRYVENVTIARDVRISGAGQLKTQIDGDRVGRVMHIKQGADVVVRDVTIQNGEIADIGAGIYTEYGTHVDLSSVAILSNTAKLGGARNLGFGGGIYNSSDMTIVNSVIAYNVAEGWGGGIDHYGPSLLIVNSTIAENTSGSTGGGILSNGYPTGQYDLRIENSTIARNKGASGLAYYNLGGIPDAVRLVNSIVAENQGAQCSGNIINSGGNAVSDGTCGSVAQTLVALDPAGLMVLGDTMGIRLTAQSMAWDRITLDGTCAHEDQRGVARPQDGDLNGVVACDAGAIEMTAADFGATPAQTPTPGISPTPTPALNCTLSINGGRMFTNQRVVTVTANVQDAVSMRLANDGGFSNSVTQAYSRVSSWTLNDPGKRIATMVVYARFDGPASVLCGGASLSDDIIYDPQLPTLSFTSPDPITRSGEVSVTLTIAADDQEAGSGVAEMQISKRSDFAGAQWQPFEPVVKVNARFGETIYARVNDAAGNVSTSRITVAGATSKQFLPLLALRD